MIVDKAKGAAEGVKEKGREDALEGAKGEGKSVYEALKEKVGKN